MRVGPRFGRGDKYEWKRTTKGVKWIPRKCQGKREPRKQDYGVKYWGGEFERHIPG